MCVCVVISKASSEWGYVAHLAMRCLPLCANTCDTAQRKHAPRGNFLMLYAEFLGRYNRIYQNYCKKRLVSSSYIECSETT